MPIMQDELEVERLRNLVEAFGWVLKTTSRTGDEMVVTFAKPCMEDIPADAVGADSS